MAGDTVPVPIYFPRPLYEWLVLCKARGAGSLTTQVVLAVEAERLRAEMQAAVADVTPSPGALEAIQEKIRRDQQ